MPPEKTTSAKSAKKSWKVELTGADVSGCQFLDPTTGLLVALSVGDSYACADEGTQKRLIANHRFLKATS